MIFTMVRSMARNGHRSFCLCIQGDSMTMRGMRPRVWMYVFWEHLCLFIYFLSTWAQYIVIYLFLLLLDGY